MVPEGNARHLKSSNNNVQRGQQQPLDDRYKLLRKLDFVGTSQRKLDENFYEGLTKV